MKITKDLSPKQHEELRKTLKSRFEKNMSRHENFDWANIQERLNAHPEKSWSLLEMESTGGEPDVVDFDKKTGEFVFFDCSAESPIHRRNACYDRAALDARKTFKPKNTALDMAEAMGIELLTEEQYLRLQELGAFDTKTSSWLKTPPEIRKLGGAIFGDRRYNRVFVFHNGADSYYSSRGFRASLKI